MSNPSNKPASLLVCSALGLGLSASAFAMDVLPSGYMAAAASAGSAGKDHKADSDKDGRISKAEFEAAHPDMADRFKTHDANSDGYLDEAEHAAHETADMKSGMKAGEGKCGEGKCGGAA